MARASQQASFGTGLFSFLTDLRANNNRDWFAAKKHRYEEQLLDPALDFINAFGPRLEKISPHFRADARASGGSLFRIYRDTRFAKDKSPYKTHIGGYVAIAGGGQGPSVAAPLYLHVGATECFAAAGHYMMDGPQLARFRAAVIDERRGAELAATLRKLGRAGFTVESHDVLQRVPRGFDPEHPRAELLRRKGLIVAFPDLPRALLVSHGLADWLVAHTKRAVPLVEWLASLAE
jgi:uncharacterized protein (TIGR02453 family)